ncbi:MAG: endonuclease/exonuclease/phosphatase family protein [Prevotella sp.]|nr:endonuclease/exonuclease/phosphatase family protein [Prevotella sp.]MBR6937322.1 endonuclease/exonuclease/phosphatase family protein [Prevotella sp.]
MKRILLVAILMVCAVVVSAQDLYVGTYNIRYKNKDDSIKGNVWTKRCQVMCDQINFESPDVLGMQEVLVGQLHDFQRLLDNYSYIGVGRDDGKEAGEYAAIFYKNDRVKLLDSGNFWLNETPDVPKLGWDAACIRICTWGKFKDLRTKKKFYFFNLHMDHVGVVARREAAKLVVSRIKEMAQDAPVVLTGDFNVDQTDEIYGIFTHSGILKDSYENARIRFAENGTFNSFKVETKTDSRIDHVFVSPSFKVEAYGLRTDSYWAKGRRNLSDHYPVFVKLRGE